MLNLCNDNRPIFVYSAHDGRCYGDRLDILYNILIYISRKNTFYSFICKKKRVQFDDQVREEAMRDG